MQTKNDRHHAATTTSLEGEDAILTMARRDLTVRGPLGDDVRIWDRARRLERAVLQVADLVDRQSEANRVVLRLAALYLLAGWVEQVRRGKLTVDDFMRRPTSMAQYALAVRMLDPEFGPIGDDLHADRVYAIRPAAVTRLGDDAKRAARVLAAHAGMSALTEIGGNNAAPKRDSGRSVVRESSLAHEFASMQHDANLDLRAAAPELTDTDADLDTHAGASALPIEVRILADAERLDWPTQICEQALARTASTRSAISQWTEFLLTRKNYGYWDEYLRGDFQFEPVRQAARWRITRITACIDLLQEIFHSEDLSAQQ